MTKTQLEVLRALWRMYRMNGVAPTLDEVGEELGISRPTAHQHVTRLARMGLVESPPPNTPRGRIPTRRGRRLLFRHLGALALLREAWSLASAEERKEFIGEVGAP